MGDTGLELVRNMREKHRFFKTAVRNPVRFLQTCLSSFVHGHCCRNRSEMQSASLSSIPSSNSTSAYLQFLSCRQREAAGIE